MFITLFLSLINTNNCCHYVFWLNWYPILLRVAPFQCPLVSDHSYRRHSGARPTSHEKTFQSLACSGKRTICHSMLFVSAHSCPKEKVCNWTGAKFFQRFCTWRRGPRLVESVTKGLMYHSVGLHARGLTHNCPEVQRAFPSWTEIWLGWSWLPTRLPPYFQQALE